MERRSFVSWKSSGRRSTNLPRQPGSELDRLRQSLLPRSRQLDRRRTRLEERSRERCSNKSNRLQNPDPRSRKIERLRSVEILEFRKRNGRRSCRSHTAGTDERSNLLGKLGLRSQRIGSWKSSPERQGSHTQLVRAGSRHCHQSEWSFPRKSQKGLISSTHSFGYAFCCSSRLARSFSCTWAL